MAAKDSIPKYDPNTEAFQMRAQWKKADNCRQMWHERWSWLLDERKQTLEEAMKIRGEAGAAGKARVPLYQQPGESLKPVPPTSAGFVGWLAAKPHCQLEIYTPWLAKYPVRAPDAWEAEDYEGPL